jgi:hypothetical protein
MYSMVTGAQAGGSAIPEAVAMETAMEEVEVVVPVDEVTEGAAPDLEAAVAPEVVVGVHVDALPEASTEVVVRSPEIQDAEPIRSTPIVDG